MSDIDPADVTAVARTIPEPFNPDLVDAPLPAGDQKKPLREGLPSGYRMRADAHYVEQLTSRRAEKSPIDAARAASKDDARDARDRRTERLLAQLAEGIATIESTAGLLASDASPIARRVNLDLIRSHAWRASWLLRANGVLQGAARVQARPRQLGFLLGQIRAGFAAECRLTGIDLRVHTADWNAVVVVDEQSLITGVAGAVFSTLALLDDAERVAITVTATTSAGHFNTIEITQDDVTVAVGINQWFAEASWTDAPGAWAGALPASTAKAVAQQHGGDAAFLLPDRGGSTIRMTFRRAS